MITLFEEILQELGKDLSLDLKPDDLNSCCLNIDEKILVYIQIDKDQKALLIGIEILQLLPGKFQENIFCHALKANAQIPKIGTFGFNEKDSSLVLFEFIPLQTLKIEEVKKMLAQLIDKGILWKDAIESGNPAPK